MARIDLLTPCFIQIYSLQPLMYLFLLYGGPGVHVGDGVHRVDNLDRDRLDLSLVVLKLINYYAETRSIL